MSFFSSAIKPIKTYLQLTLAVPYKTISTGIKESRVPIVENTNKFSLVELIKKQKAMTSPEINYYRLRQRGSVSSHYIQEANRFYH